jgi:hypothetical protein
MFLSIIFIILITIGIGLPLTLWIDPKHSTVGRLGLSYLLGIGLFTFVMYLSNMAGFKLTAINIILLFLLFAVPLLFFLRKEITTFYTGLKSQTKNLRFTFLEKIVLWASGFFITSSFINTVYWPIYAWDALTLYDFRAKVFALTGFIRDSISIQGGQFLGYPLLTSLSHSIVYLLGGNNPQFLYSMFYLSFGLVFYFLVRELINRDLSLIITLLVLTIPQIFAQSALPYTNLPYVTYLSLGSIYLYFGIKKKDFGLFIISALLIGLSTWVRAAEPFWLSCIVLAAAGSIFVKKWLWPVAYIAIAGSIMLPWRTLLATYHVNGANAVTQIVTASQSVAQNFQYSILKSTFEFIMANVVKAYLPYFVLFGAVLVIKSVLKSKDWFFILLIFFDLALTFAGTLLFFRFVSYGRNIPDSLTRMAMFIPILIVFAAVELLSEMSKRKNSQTKI